MNRAFCPHRTAKKGFLALFCPLEMLWFELYRDFSDSFSEEEFSETRLLPIRSYLTFAAHEPTAQRQGEQGDL